MSGAPHGSRLSAVAARYLYDLERARRAAARAARARARARPGHGEHGWHGSTAPPQMRAVVRLPVRVKRRRRVARSRPE